MGLVVSLGDQRRGRAFLAVHPPSVAASVVELVAVCLFVFVVDLGSVCC